MKTENITLQFNLEEGVQLESSENITAQNLVYVMTHLSAIVKSISKSDENNPSYADIMTVVRDAGEKFRKEIPEQ